MKLLLSILLLSVSITTSAASLRGSVSEVKTNNGDIELILSCEGSGINSALKDVIYKIRRELAEVNCGVQQLINGNYPCQISEVSSCNSGYPIHRLIVKSTNTGKSDILNIVLGSFNKDGLLDFDAKFISQSDDGINVTYHVDNVTIAK
jgi:hypothetical protein